MKRLIMRVKSVLAKIQGNVLITAFVKEGKCNVGDCLILDRTGKEFKVEAIEEKSYGLDLLVSEIDFADIEENDRVYRKGEEPEGFYDNLSNTLSCYYCGTRDFCGVMPGDIRDGIHKDINGMACPRCEHAITITNRILSGVALSDSDGEAIKVLNDTIEHLNSVVEDIRQGKY